MTQRRCWMRLLNDGKFKGSHKRGHLYKHTKWWRYDAIDLHIVHNMLWSDLNTMMLHWALFTHQCEVYVVLQHALCTRMAEFEHESHVQKAWQAHEQLQHEVYGATHTHVRVRSATASPHICNVWGTRTCAAHILCNTTYVSCFTTISAQRMTNNRYPRMNGCTMTMMHTPEMVSDTHNHLIHATTAQNHDEWCHNAYIGLKQCRFN